MAANESINSQPKLAAKAGIGKSTVFYVLQGENDATIGTVAALARAFGCQPWELLVDPDNPLEDIVRRLLGR